MCKGDHFKTKGIEIEQLRWACVEATRGVVLMDAGYGAT